MKHLIFLPLLFLCCFGMSAEGVKIAIINKYEIDELLMTRILAKADNATAKAEIEAIEKQIAEIQNDLAEKLQDPSQREEVMKKLGELHTLKSTAEEGVEMQVKGELIKVVKVATDNRYAAVFDNAMFSRGVITKNIEVIDITIDVKEYLLTNP